MTGKLGKLGVWASLDLMTSAELASFAQAVEHAGFSTL